MNRRGFLGLMGLAATAATLSVSLPNVRFPEEKKSGRLIIEDSDGQRWMVSMTTDGTLVTQPIR